MPHSDFFVQPANPLGGLQDVIGRNIAAQGQQQRSESDKARIRGLLQQAGAFIKTNDHARLVSLMTENPEIREHLSSVQKDAAQFGKTATDKSKARKIQTLKDALISTSPRKVLEEELNQLRGEGGDTKQLQSLLDSNISDEELNDMLLSGLAIEQPESARAYMETTKKPAKKFSMGSGRMAGYSFDPTTGAFSMEPGLRVQLEKDAARLAGKEKFKAKDVAGINDKVTALTKDVGAMVAASKSLEKLRESSTPAAQVAAVFMFMKALDPTSTVRESELGLIYSAEGAAQGMANRLTKLLGEGQLSTEGFLDLVNTSKDLANSAIDSSAIEVNKYLAVLEDNLTKKQLDSLLARVPERLVQSGAAEPIKNAKGWPLKVDDKGNKAYVGPNNEIEEVQ